MASTGSANVHRAAAPPRRRNSRLRVLQMVNFLSLDGGAERLLLGLATHFPRDRVEPWVCAPRGGEAAPIATLTDAGIPFVDLGRRRKRDYYRFSRLLRFLRDQRFDVLHAHLFVSNLWGTVGGRACGVPVVLAHEHTWSYQGEPLRLWLNGRVIGRLATRFVAVSNDEAEKMVRIEKVPREKVKVMPTAYVPPAVSSNGDLRSELGLSSGTPLVGCAAVFRPQKALEVLLDAHARILKHVPDAHLILAGQGPCLEQLRRHAGELGIVPRTHFIGRRGDIDSVLGALDVAAMSSDYEGTPLLAFECMASGTPLVATAVGGLPEVVDDGRTGLLVPPRDPERLAAAVISLLLDPKLRERIAAAAAQRLERYAIEHVAAEFAELYGQLAERAGVR